MAALYLFEKSEACGCNCPEESVHCQWPSNAGGVPCVYRPRAASLSPWLGLLRQSIFGRLAAYEDVNDADRLCHDPAMRWLVGDRAISEPAASASQMGLFETKWLSRPEIPLSAAPIAVRAFAMDAQNQTMALACPAIRGKLFTKCELPHTAQPIPERYCLRVGGSGRSSGECRLRRRGDPFPPYPATYS